jgi:hypothetical protein
VGLSTLQGFWAGLGTGSAVQAVAQIIVLARIDWNTEVRALHVFLAALCCTARVKCSVQSVTTTPVLLI